MSTQKHQKNFEIIYNETYEYLLKFVIFKCDKLEDVNDIIQDTYVELFKVIDKQEINDVKAFLIGITKNKLKKYYSLKTKVKNLFINTNNEDEGVFENLRDDFDIEDYVFENITLDNIWDYLDKKNALIAKIFYLHYAEDITIKEISEELNITESSVKNHLYRTLKELKELFIKESDCNV